MKSGRGNHHVIGRSIAKVIMGRLKNLILVLAAILVMAVHAPAGDEPVHLRASVQPFLL
ncbi:MAG: hypothetical protein ACM3TN_11590 [Alphaproteobacteria bacterium]